MSKSSAAGTPAGHRCHPASGRPAKTRDRRHEQEWIDNHREPRPAPPDETNDRVWHICGMSRTRLSTTVDKDLLQAARRVRSGYTDAAMIDEALRALVARYRSAEIDASYAVYDEHPLNEPDEWGDLASFREAAGRS
jgi:hypothetical protein